MQPYMRFSTRLTLALHHCRGLVGTATGFLLLFWLTSPADGRHPFATQVDDFLAEYLQQDFKHEIESVTLEASDLVVTGKVASKPKSALTLVEVRPHESLSDYEQLPGIPIELSSGRNFTHRVPRFDGRYDRVLSKWALVGVGRSGKELMTPARYVSEQKSAAKWPSLQPERPRSQKGLGGIDFRVDLSDLAELGVHSITVNMNLGSLLVRNNAPGVRHVYRGKPYQLSRVQIERYDRVLSFAAKHEIVVSAIILVPILPRDTEKGRLLTHPDALEGRFSMANVATEEGVHAYAALIDFLAHRYGRPDRKFGRITHWIIHNEVDSGWIWTNLGEKGPLAYMEAYVKSMRIVYHVARTYNPSAKVFISLTHSWARPHKPKDPRFYASRSLLQILNQYSLVEGNFEWGVAYHPYPENLRDPRTWLDKSVTTTRDSPLITMKNIELLDRWLRQSDYRYQGKPRTILLSEQGYNTPDYSEESQELQAKALRFAWNKMKRLKTIETFHYHRWLDHPDEGKLLMGLRTLPGRGDGPLGAKKKAWYVWQELR